MTRPSGRTLQIPLKRTGQTDRLDLDTGNSLLQVRYREYPLVSRYSEPLWPLREETSAVWFTLKAVYLGIYPDYQSTPSYHTYNPAVEHRKGTL